MSRMSTTADTLRALEPKLDRPTLIHAQLDARFGADPRCFTGLGHVELGVEERQAVAHDLDLGTPGWRIPQQRERGALGCGRA